MNKTDITMYIFKLAILTLSIHIFSVKSELDERSSVADSSQALEKNSTRYPKEFYLKAFSYMKNSKVFKNFTLEQVTQWIDKADEWDSPDLSKRFPYYLSGYDYEDRPIWIAEPGKYNVREVVERGPEGEADLERYAFQGVLRVLKSLQAKDTASKEVRDIVIVGDWEGLDISQLTHIPTVMFTINLVRTYLDIASQGFGYAIAINVNYVAEKGFEIMRPIIGGLFERIEIYGSNKARWKAALRRKLPEKSIPTWYGGSKDFKPLLVYG